MGLLDLLPKVAGVVDKLIPDKDLAIKVKAELSMELAKSRSEVIQAEARGGWLQRSWRPITMLVFVYIIFNNYILMPYARALGLDLPVLEIPAGMWGLLKIGMGGYVLGRSGEHIAKSFIAAKGKLLK